MLPSFKPSQIVCLDHQSHTLYGEVIQIIEARQFCWMRPLILVLFEEERPTLRDFESAQSFWDMRSTADVVYPLPLFRAALDTEVLPLIMQLEEKIEAGAEESHNRQKLQRFLGELWQDIPANKITLS